MLDPARGSGGVRCPSSRGAGDIDPKPAPDNSQAQPDRIARAMDATAHGLRLLRHHAKPGMASPFDLAAGLATILRARLGPGERLGLATSAMLALPKADAEALAEAVLAEIAAARLDPVEAEGERQTAAWARHCREVGPHQRPRLTRAQARRAAAIDLGPLS
jgi:hypothetical protein